MSRTSSWVADLEAGTRSIPTAQSGARPARTKRTAGAPGRGVSTNLHFLTLLSSAACGQLTRYFSDLTRPKAWTIIVEGPGTDRHSKQRWAPGRTRCRRPRNSRTFSRPPSSGSICSGDRAGNSRIPETVGRSVGPNGQCGRRAPASGLGSRSSPGGGGAGLSRMDIPDTTLDGKDRSDGP